MSSFCDFCANMSTLHYWNSVLYPKDYFPCLNIILHLLTLSPVLNIWKIQKNYVQHRVLSSFLRILKCKIIRSKPVLQPVPSESWGCFNLIFLYPQKAVEINNYYCILHPCSFLFIYVILCCFQEHPSPSNKSIICQLNFDCVMIDSTHLNKEVY